MKKNTPSFDDLIFEGRNKAYGAYELRQLVDRHNAYGLFITGSAFLLIVLLFSLSRNDAAPLPVIKPPLDVKLSDLSDIIPERPKLAKIELNTPPPTVRTEAFNEFNPTANEVVTTSEAPRQQDLIGQHIGTETVVSDAPYSGPVDPAPMTAGTGTTTTDAPVISDPVTWAPVMPSFIGGPQALKEFLAKNISIAQVDIERGVSGKVWIRFFVDVDGTVKGATVIKDTAGGLCAERALKAVLKMPKWNPGMQNNKPVRVYYSLPVVFEVKELN